MDMIDLKAAKEEARRENWVETMPAHLLSTEDELPDEDKPPPQPECSYKTSGNTGDEWSKILEEQSREEGHGTSRATDYNKMESEDLDDDESDGNTGPEYLDAGVVEYELQTGQLRSSVRDMLSTKAKDFKDLGDKRIQVDLSFLNDSAHIDRVRRMMENTIKKYSSIPGRVEVIRVSEYGFMQFNVTNHHLFPTSDSSECPVRKQAPKRHQPRQNKEPPPVKSFVYNELIQGIILVPKFPGLPPKILKYGDSGVTVDGIGAVKLENPVMTRNEVIIQALKNAGVYKRFFNLYRLP